MKILILFSTILLASCNQQQGIDCGAVAQYAAFGDNEKLKVSFHEKELGRSIEKRMGGNTDRFAQAWVICRKWKAGGNF